MKTPKLSIKPLLMILAMASSSGAVAQERTEFKKLYNSQLGGAKVALIKANKKTYLTISYTDALPFQVTIKDSLKLVFESGYIIKLLPTHTVTSEAVQNGPGELHCGLISYYINDSEIEVLQYCKLRSLVQPIKNGYIMKSINHKKQEAIKELFGGEW